VNFYKGYRRARGNKLSQKAQRCKTACYISQAAKTTKGLSFDLADIATAMSVINTGQVAKWPSHIIELTQPLGHFSSLISWQSQALQIAL